VLAIKQLFSTQEEDFKLEVEMLKAFSNHQYRHLIKLLATYRYQGRYHLVFPYAKFNLRQYWKDTPTPEFSITTVRWMLSQCKGIATGLHAIHDYRNTNERQLISLNDGLLHPGMMENERRFGRHGDIKPENILWSDENIADAHGNRNELGCLLIADFGLMEFHRKITRSKVKPDSIVCSPTYAPPELALRTHISRAYDIWSLGCVFLEFIIWLVLGWQELEGFPAARDSPLSDGSTDDTFYTIRNEGSKPHAIVRPSVTEWVEKLHSAPRCSAFVHEFLNLISENMLAVKAGERVECGILVSKLANMLKRAEKDHEYLTRLIPLPRQEKLTVSRNQTSPRMMSESPPPSPTDGKALPRTPIAPNFDVLARLPLSQHSSQIESATGRNRENDSGARRFDGAGSGIRRVKST
jgi:serine/threonine protein kinase